MHTELCARFRYGPDGDAYLTLWIHDELVVCCRPTIAKQVGEILVRHAREAGEHYGFRVPLDAEYKIGRDWAGTALAKPIKVAPISSDLIEIAPISSDPIVAAAAIEVDEIEIEASWPDDF